jgi:hypothetical protein
MSHMDFSSWSREQEATFVVYEQRRAETQSKAWMLAGIISGVVLVAAVGIFLGVEPEIRDMGKDMNMSNLTKKGEKSPAPDSK